MKRPKLTKQLNPNTFKDFYWMKWELVDFCSQQGLSTAGMKLELVERIYMFLKTGEIFKPSIKKITTEPDSCKPLKFNTVVVNYKNDPATRKFFIDHIGSHFHFSARVNIYRKQKMTEGVKITYGDLVKEWQKENILRKDKNIQLPIMKSCEYNQFTRDYCQDNPHAKRADMIAAWKQAKTMLGARTYNQWRIKFLRNCS
jgi:hypothetical protein